MLEKEPELSLKEQAELLGVSYSSLFYEPVPPTARELAIKRRIDELYTAYPFYGSRKIAVILRPEFGVSRQTVQAYMREMGIFALVPGPNTSKPAPEHQIYPYLLRNLTAERPNHIWGIDITYIRLLHGWLYLVAVLDVCTRRVLGWAMHQILDARLVIAALRMALRQRRPTGTLIVHSDRGMQFASAAYRQVLAQHGLIASMSRKGNCYDNAFIESFWSSLKYEVVYHRRFATFAEARAAIFNYIETFYNRRRLHSSLAYLTPILFESKIDHRN